jgi:ABC-type multidrug transport system ATPase subunit
MIVVRNLGKRYRTLRVLENVSFEIHPGEALALWGANGAGKTTLLKAILGLIEFEGEIQVNGCDVRRQGKAARSNIGYVPQEFVFYDMSVVESMVFYARLKKVKEQIIPTLLERLDLKDHARKAVSTLSGGLRQRLALAVALLSEPSILILDEPMANLDAQARRDYLGLLVGLRKEGKTILFASHRFEEVHVLANRVLALELGRPAELLSLGELRLRYLPELDVVLWVPEGQRAAALTCLQAKGLSAHLNGRGTVVVRVPEAHKMQPLQALNDGAIAVLDFELEEVQQWS